LLAGQNITRWPEHLRQNSSAGYSRTRSAAQRPTCPSPKTSRWLPDAADRAVSDVALSRKLREGLARPYQDAEHGPREPPRQCLGSLSGGQRQALTLLDGLVAEAQNCCCSTSTPPRSILKSADQVIRLTHEIIQRDKLTTLMVTHSMQQAVHLGDRIVMMHRRPGAS